MNKNPLAKYNEEKNVCPFYGLWFWEESLRSFKPFQKNYIEIILKRFQHIGYWNSSNMHTHCTGACVNHSNK